MSHCTKCGKGPSECQCYVRFLDPQTLWQPELATSRPEDRIVLIAEKEPQPAADTPKVLTYHFPTEINSVADEIILAVPQAGIDCGQVYTTSLYNDRSIYDDDYRSGLVPWSMVESEYGFELNIPDVGRGPSPVRSEEPWLGTFSELTELPQARIEYFFDEVDPHRLMREPMWTEETESWPSNVDFEEDRDAIVKLSWTLAEGVSAEDLRAVNARLLGWPEPDDTSARFPPPPTTRFRGRADTFLTQPARSSTMNTNPMDRRMTDQGFAESWQSVDRFTQNIGQTQVPLKPGQPPMVPAVDSSYLLLSVATLLVSYARSKKNRTRAGAPSPGADRRGRRAARPRGAAAHRRAGD